MLLCNLTPITTLTNITREHLTADAGDANLTPLSADSPYPYYYSHLHPHLHIHPRYHSRPQPFTPEHSQKNAASPMLVMLLGSVSVVIPEHPANEQS